MFKMRQKKKGEGFRVKCSLLLSDFNQRYNVSVNCSKTPKIQII
jgi:hypothetical protein